MTVGSISGKAFVGGIGQADGYRIHTFTSSSDISVNNSISVDYLIVAGGGGGAEDIGGGGGAGGMNTGNTTLGPGNYTIIVGASGRGSENGGTITVRTKGIIRLLIPLNVGVEVGRAYHKCDYWYNGGSGGGGAGQPNANPDQFRRHHYRTGQGNNGGSGAPTITAYGGGGGGGAGGCQSASMAAMVVMVLQ